MKKLILVVTSLTITAAIVMLAYSLISVWTRPTGIRTSSVAQDQPAAAPTVDPLVTRVSERLAGSGITLNHSPVAPKVSRQAAIDTALKNLPTDANSSPTAAHVVATNLAENNKLSVRPVWVVSFLQATSARAGPPHSPLPTQIDTYADVLIDSVTGEFMVVIESSRAPITEPSTDDCDQVAC